MYHIKNDKRSLQSSEWLYEALKQLLSEKDFSEIKVTEVVSKAKIGRSTFYRNFDTLEDVLHYKADESYAACGKHLIKIIFEQARSNENKKSAQLFFLPFFRYWYYNFEIIDLLISAKKEDILKHAFVKMVDDLRGEYPDVDIAYYDYFIEMRAAVSIAILSQWVKTNRQESPEKLYEIFQHQMEIDKYLINMAEHYS
ncbi:hypothetical protein [Fusibacter bizertensis]